MKHFSNRVRLTGSALLMSAALSACVVAPPRPAVVYQTYPVYTQVPPAQTVYVDVAPPPPRVDVVPVVPFPGAVWVGGYWGWSGGRHVWTAGHYIRPVPGYRFEAHRWENYNGRWAIRGGFWVR